MKLKSVRGLGFCYIFPRLNRNIGFFGGPVSRLTEECVTLKKNRGVAVCNDPLQSKCSWLL